MIITVDNTEYSLHPVTDYCTDKLPIVWFNDSEEPVLSIMYRINRSDASFTNLGTMPVTYCTEQETLKQAVESAIRKWVEEEDGQEIFDDES